MENQPPQPTRVGVKKKELKEDERIALVNIGLGAEMVGKLDPKFMRVSCVLWPKILLATREIYF